MTLREQALALAKQGFKVFPLKQGAKKPPLIKAWEVNATTDEAQIVSWWVQWPEANIGIHTDGLLVLDVDAHKGGMESLAALEQEIELEATYETESPRGGRHIYYRLPAGAAVHNGADVFLPGIDVRTTGGYVVAAGSRTAAGEYTVVADDPVVEADPQIVARCSPVKPERQERVDGDVSTDADAAVARAVDFLRTHPVAVEGQGGDHHTFRTICRLRDFGVPQERALEALEEWNTRCVPPWETTDLEIKIENAYTYAQDAAGKLTPEALGFEIVPNSGTDVPNVGTPPAPAESTAEMHHPSDIELGEILGAEYLIKGVLERQSNAVIFGGWNVGKTFVVLDMSASIVCEIPWFGKRVRRGRVLYLGYEGIRAMKKRIIALRDKYPLLKDKATPFAWSPIRNPLTKPEGNSEMVAALVKFAKRHGGAPDLIVIDPLANALGGDDADAGLMGLLNSRIAEVMRAQRCTVLRVHHSGHSNQDRARGHSSLPAGVDTEIRVTESEIATTKQRDDVRGKFNFKLEIVTLGKDSDNDDVTTCVVQQVEDNALDPALTNTQRELFDALKVLRGEGGHVSKTDIADRMPPGCTPAQKRELIAVLERKMYLKVEGNGWVLAERGPMGIFD